MKKLEFRRVRKSFTLIEMLAVCAIISILAGLVIPIVGYAKTQTKKAKAKEEMNNLRVALRMFYQEYGYWPQTTSWTEMSSMLSGNINPYSGAAGPSFGSTNNTRSIRFMEFKRESLSSSAEFNDPWGMPYLVLMDAGNTVGAVGDAAWTDATREDGQVSNPAGGNAIQTQIAIYSFGADKTDGNGADNTDDVKTWTN